MLRPVRDASEVLLFDVIACKTLVAELPSGPSALTCSQARYRIMSSAVQKKVLGEGEDPPKQPASRFAA